MSRVQLQHTYEEIISLDNLLLAWQEFAAGKRGRRDVQVFELQLMQQLIVLHEDLAGKRYRHSAYQAFRISDPKPRQIHKASVRDRVLHHAVYRILYPFFDRTFIADSFSCREKKGTHKALDRFRLFARQVSLNHTQTCWVLKCDIRKFFATIDQNILLGILDIYIPDRNILWLMERIIRSFHSSEPGKGLPLGNLTSQLLVNIYMNEFDQYVKHVLKVKHYIRYADDFVLFSQDRTRLESLIPYIQAFLERALALSLHPGKVYIKTAASGVDWLGWVHFPDHRVVRTATRRRMLKRIQEHPARATMQSYLGLLTHGNTEQLRASILGMKELTLEE